jgi:hypothetical protein
MILVNVCNNKCGFGLKWIVRGFSETKGSKLLREPEGPEAAAPSEAKVL